MIYYRYSTAKHLNISTTSQMLIAAWLANEILPVHMVTSGGSGFGIMSLIVGMERNFINQQQGLDRMNKIVTFLEGADRFHGAWPHWINGHNGDVMSFSANDNGGDLVETAFLLEGLITFRQYPD
jgi:hypothetical protein